MAAVLAVGPGAVLSHRSAAALWGIRSSAGARIEVTAPRALRPQRGIQVHHSVVAADEMTLARGIPVTTVPRSLLDLAAVVDRRQVELALEQAELLRLVDELSLADLVGRHPGRRGVAAIKTILAARRIGATVTRSELEERFLALLEDADLSRPEVNAPVQLTDRWIEADCLWRTQRLIVELDGHASHARTSGFERDRLRDRVLQSSGWRVVPITWRQLHEDPEAVISDVRKLLRDRGPTPGAPSPSTRTPPS